MRALYAVALIVVIFGTIASQFEKRNDGIDPMLQVTDATDEYIYRKLANGAVVYERVEGPTDIVNIAPAAGDGVAGHGDGAPSVAGEIKYKYDPLTQTYRRQMVDSNGNSGQDIIRDPLNP